MNKKNIIIISSIVVVLILGIILYLFLGTDMFKSDKQLFVKYLSQMKEGKQILEQDIFEAYVEKKENTPYNTSGQISLSLPEEMQGNGDFDISYEGKTDASNKKQETVISLNSGDTSILPITYRRVGDTYGVQFNDVVKQFVAVENNNLKEFFAKFGMTDLEAIPDKIEFDNYKLTDKEIQELSQRYMNVITDYCKDKKYSKVEQDGMKGYRLTLSDAEVMEIIKNILNTVKSDQLIESKIKEIYGNILNENDVDEMYTTITEGIDEAIQNMDEEESLGKADFLTITTFAKGGKLQNAEIVVDTTMQKVVIDIISAEDKFEISMNVTDSDSGAEVDETGKKVDDDKNAEVAMMYDLNKNMSSNLNTMDDYSSMMSSSSSNKFVKMAISKNRGASDISYNISIQVGESQDNILGEISINANYTGIKEMQNVKESYVITISENINQTNYSININNDVQFADSTEIEDFTQENSVILNEKDANYMQQLMKALGEQISAKVLEKMSAVGASFTNPLSSVGMGAQIYSQATQTNQMIDSASAAMEEQEVQAFNANLEAYEGEMTGSRVKALISTIESSNSIQDNKVEIELDGATASSSTVNVQAGSTYNVSFEKNSDGYINKAIIETAP